MEEWIFDPSCRVTHQADYDSHINWARANSIDLTRPAKFVKFEPPLYGRPDKYSLHLIFDTGYRAGESKHLVTHCFKPININQSLEDFM